MKERLVLKKKVKIILIKYLLGIILLLSGMIIVKNNPSWKKILKEEIYEKSFSFIENKKIYEKYFGNYLSLKNKEEVKKVSNNKIPYESIEKVNNGIKLTVPEKCPIEALESGVVVYLGEKENYGNVLIIEQVNGIEILYSNIDFHNIKLYDYIEKEEIIGEAINKEIFLLFQKNGEIIDYQEQI